MTLSLIAAVGKNRELGFAGKLPWHIPSDLKRFRDLTRGHTVIMGSRTYISIGRPLPERRNVVLSKEARFEAPGCEVANSLEEALALVKNEDEVFVIGGGQVYAAALPFANRLYLTEVDAAPRADTFFPAFDKNEWKGISSQRVAKNKTEPYAYTFTVYEKIT